MIGLDLWRALLMAAGLLVHGSIWLEPRPLFAWIAYASSGTRMGVFFAIAGYLAACGLRGRSVRRWSERRLARLLPPTLFGLAMLCPAIAALHFLYHGDAGVFWREAAKLHHLWFLVALAAYTGVAAAVWPAWTRLGTPRLPTWALLGVTAIAGLGIGAIVHALLPIAGRDSLLWEERRMLLHVPVFVLGLALGRRDAAGWRAPGGAIIPLILLLLVFGWRIATQAWWSGAAATVLADLDDLARLTVSPPAAALLVLRSAAAIRRVPAWLDRSAAAALTLYLLHVPLILIVHRTTAGWGLDPHARFALAVTVSGLLAYQFHHRVVARVPLLAFLINGAPLPRRRPSLPVGLAPTASA